MNVIAIRPAQDERPEPEVLAEEDEGAQLRLLYDVLLRRWRPIVAAAFVAFSGFMTYTLTSPRIYTATALVMVNPALQRVISPDQSIDSSSPVSSTAVDSEIEMLRSDSLKLQLIEEMNLADDPEWNSGLPLQGPLRRMSSGADVLDDAESTSDRIVRTLGEALSVRRRGLSYGIEVSLDSRDPRRAAELLNRFVDLYLRSQTQVRFEASQRASEWLGQRVEKLRREVQVKERDAEAFRIRNGLSVAAGGVASQRPQSENVLPMMVQARADLAEKEAKQRRVQQSLGRSAEPARTALYSPTVADLRTREAEIAQAMDETRQRHPADHPDMLALANELESVRQRSSNEIQRVTASLENEVAVARARYYTLQGILGDVAGASAENNEVVMRYRELLRDAAAARVVEESFLRRSHEIADQGELPVATSRVVSSARPPSSPSEPDLVSSFLMAVLLAGLAGAGLAFLTETLDASVSNTEDAARRLGVPVLASVPLLKPHNMRFLAPRRRNPADYLVDQPNSGFAESLRVLRTALRHGRIDRKSKVIAVTAAVPNEGKTTMSLCLARISAMSGQRVVVVDCDLRRPSLSEMVAPGASLGLLDVLSGQGGWRSALVQDPESTAFVLPTLSSSDSTSQDAFASEAMLRLVEELRADFDLIVFDLAPVLAIAEARTVATHADLALVIVRADKTPAGATRTAIRELKHAGVDVVGIALNCIDPRRAGRGAYGGESLYYRDARSYYSNRGAVDRTLVNETQNDAKLGKNPD